MAMIRVPALGAIGVVADPYEQDVPATAWSRAQNARFGEKGAQTFLGHELVMPGALPEEGSIDVSGVVGASDVALSSSIIPVSASNNYTPITLLGWIKRPQTSGVLSGQLVLELASNAVSSRRRLGVNFNGVENKGIASVSDNGGGFVIPTNNDVPDDEWTPMVATFPSPVDANIYIPGDSFLYNAINQFPILFDRIHAGKGKHASHNAAMTAFLAHLAIFSGTISADQIAAWYAGSNAFEVEALNTNPGAPELIAYWPGRTFVSGLDTYMQDMVGGSHLLLHADAVWDAEMPDVTAVAFDRPVPIVPTWLKNFPSLEVPRWAYADNNKVYCAQEGNHTEITRAAGDYNAVDRWQGTIFNGVGILNNGEDIPQMWDPIDDATVLDDLNDWPTGYKCRFIKGFKNFLVAGHIYDGSLLHPYRVLWSHPATPGNTPTNWDVSDPASDAGWKDVFETNDYLVDGLQLGELFMLYRERTVWAMQFIGGSEKMRLFPVYDAAGILWKDCVVQIAKGHVVASWDDIVIHQGTKASFQSILDKRYRRTLNETRDPENYRNCFMTLNIPEKEVWFCYPEVGSTYATMALVWNWVDGQVGFRDLPSVPFADSGPVVLEEV